jgi:hypothetical protein
LMTTQPNRYSALIWRKSSASGADGGCVEVAKAESSVLVRDSRNRTGRMLAFDLDQWRTFVRRVKNQGGVPG